MRHAIEKALRIAHMQVDRNPSEAAKAAGNYAKGHLAYKGLDITIENPKGSERSGIDRDGKRWKVAMPSSYGYIKGSEGHDGDHVDCYVGPDHESDKVWVIDQVDADTGKFDEHKCFLSFPSEDAVLKDYHKAFSDGKAKDRIGGITEFTIDSFKQWLRHSDTTKPLAAKKYAAGGVVSHGAPMFPNRPKNVSAALNVASRRGKADGGEVDNTPILGPLGIKLANAIRVAPQTTAAALEHLSRATTFPEQVAENPRGWGRALPNPGSITADTPPSMFERAMQIGEMPARAYIGQAKNFGNAAYEASQDPSLANLTNAGVQGGLALGSPALTAGSAGLGFGAAAARDLMPYVMPSAEARKRPNIQSELKPALMEPAAADMSAPDPLEAKVQGDPQLELLYGAYKQAVAKAGVGVPGVDKASSDAIRARASDQANQIMAQISAALEKKAQSERDLKQGNYNQQVEEANAARDLEMGRGRRFADTEVGQVYDKMGGLAPMVMGMIPGAVTNLARGPAEGLGEKVLRGGLGAISGVMSNNVPLAYNAFSTPVENPEQRAAAAYSFNLPEGHPDKAKYEALANSLPKTNPTRDLAAAELYDPKKFGERAVQGGLEGFLGSHLGEMVPGALRTIPEAAGRGAGALVKPETYGFTGDYALQKAKDAALLQAAKRSSAADAAVDITPPSTGQRLELSRSPEAGGPTASLPALPSSPVGQSGSDLLSPPQDPALSAALNVAKRQTGTPASSPVFSPDDLLTDQGSKLLKEFKSAGVRQFQEGDKVVHRVAPGREGGGQYTTAPKRGKAKSSTKAEDSSSKVTPSTNDTLTPPPPANDTFAKGGVIKGVLDLARKYARGGVVVGPVVGPTGGREDALPVDVPASSFVIPADVVSALGTGNTLSGNQYLDQMLGGKQITRAAGGKVPIKISDGEYVVSPETVQAIGGGDMDAGHRALENFVLQTRAQHIKTLQNMPAPSR